MSDESPATISWFSRSTLLSSFLTSAVHVGKATRKHEITHFTQERKMLTQVRNNFSPGPNLYFWMLHRRRPSFPVFSCIWSPWQRTSLSQSVPVRAREAGGHLDGHGASGPVSHKLKTSQPLKLVQECTSLLGPILSRHTHKDERKD